MFCDEANITVRAGKGEMDSSPFAGRNIFQKGGPDGGDGGRGGDVLFRANANADTLLELRTKKFFAAEKGTPGGIQKKTRKICRRFGASCSRRNANSGSVWRTNRRFKSSQCGMRCGCGGRGGYGNAHFTSSIRQTPRFAELGNQVKNEVSI